MAFELMKLVRTANLPRPERAVLMAFADRANADGVAWPGVRLVAHETGYTQRHVRRLLATLGAQGVLVPVQNAAGGRGKSCRRRLVADAVQPIVALQQTMTPTSSFRPGKGGTGVPERMTRASGKDDTGVSRTNHEAINKTQQRGDLELLWKMPLDELQAIIERRWEIEAAEVCAILSLAQPGTEA